MCSEKIWRPVPFDGAAVEQLAGELGVSPLIARLLVRRGIASNEQARSFLDDRMTDLPDPFKLRDMKKAVDRLRAAIAHGERVWVYGDYDVDGVASTSLLWSVLAEMGAHVDYYVPHRFNDGYGLHTHVLETAKQKGISLIVTVDTGISAEREAFVARHLGIDLIITDHHQPPAQLPDAYAIIDPKCEGCCESLQMLAGVGIAFMLASALRGEWVIEHIDLVALGSIADLVPLTGATRVLVREGLKRWNDQPRCGLQALAQAAGLGGKTITSTNVGFSIAPRINAAGRMDSASGAVGLLTATDSDEALQLANRLEEQNRERRQTVEAVLEAALEQLAEHADMANASVLVAAGEDWHAGVIGIVASRLMDRFQRSVVVITVRDGVGKGSARSMADFDIHAAFLECSDLLVQFGGHKAAAGLTIAAENISALRARLTNIADRKVAMDNVPALEYDAIIAVGEVTNELVDQLQRLEPFGMGNPQPTFMFSGLKVAERRRVGNEQIHLQLKLEQQGAIVSAIAFRRGPEEALVGGSQRVDAIGELVFNEWRGRRVPQMMLKEWRASRPVIVDGRNAANKAAWLQTVAIDYMEQARLVLQQWGAIQSDEIDLGAFSREAAAGLDTASGNRSLVRDDGLAPSSTGIRYDVRALALLNLPEQTDEVCALAARYPLVETLFLLDHASTSREKPRMDRNHFASIYRYMREHAPVSISDIARYAQSMWVCSLEDANWQADIAINVFSELGFTSQAKGMYHMNQEVPRRALSESPTYIRIVAGIPESDDEPTWYRTSFETLVDRLLELWTQGVDLIESERIHSGNIGLS